MKLRYVDELLQVELPISISSSRGRVFVVNAGGTGNIAGFTFNGTGHFSPLPNSIKSLSTDVQGPAQISFSPNGTVLSHAKKQPTAYLRFQLTIMATLEISIQFLQPVFHLGFILPLLKHFW